MRSLIIHIFTDNDLREILFICRKIYVNIIVVIKVKKYKWLVLNLFCILVAVLSLTFGILTKDQPYTAIFSIPIIVCVFLAAFFLFKFHETHYSKNSFNHKKKVMKEKIKNYNSITIKPEDLFYYLNRKLIGGEEVLIEYNNALYFVGRQIYTKFYERNKSKAESYYSLDRHRYGTYSELINNLEKTGVPINDLDSLKIVALEGKKPKIIEKKRDFSKAKKHSFLPTMSIVGIVSGLIILCTNFGLNNNAEKLMCICIGAFLMLVGCICLIVLINKIKKETLV